MDEKGRLHEIFLNEQKKDQESPLAALQRQLVESQGVTPSMLVQADGKPVPDHWTLFATGEVVEVKGRSFRVAYMNTESIMLEPIPVSALTVRDGPEYLDKIEADKEYLCPQCGLPVTGLDMLAGRVDPVNFGTTTTCPKCNQLSDIYVWKER